AAALEVLGRSMRAYLAMQVDAGADVVQLFDSWAGILDRASFERLAVPSAAVALERAEVPSIYFAPGAGHSLDVQPRVGATGYGVDWRIPIDEAWDRLGPVPVQGNLDPAVLLGRPDEIRRAVADLRARTAGRRGHVVNLGHGIDRRTPPEHVAVLVEAV